MMDTLFQELLAVHDDGTCMHHPNVLLVIEGDKYVRSCRSCEQEVKQQESLKRDERCWEQDSSNYTGTTSCGSDDDSSGSNLQDELCDSTRTQREQDGPSSYVSSAEHQQRLMECVLSRWCQVQRLPLQQAPLTSSGPYMIQQLDKLDRRVEQQGATLRENQATMLQLQNAMYQQQDTFQKLMQNVLQAVHQSSSASPSPSDERISLAKASSQKSVRSLETPTLLRREPRRRSLGRSVSSNMHRPNDIQLDGSFSRMCDKMPNMDSIFDVSDKSSVDSRPGLFKKTSSAKSSKLAGPPMEIILEGESHLKKYRGPGGSRSARSDDLFRRDSFSEASPSRWSSNSSSHSRENSRPSIHTSRRGPHAPSEVFARMYSKRQVSSLTLDPSLSAPGNDEDNDEEEEQDDDIHGETETWRPVVRFPIKDKGGKCGIYTGTINGNEEPEGVGTMKYYGNNGNDSVFKGEWEAGLRHGPGEEKMPNGSIRRGLWQWGDFVGKQDR